jgi:hypothetical protein
MTKRGFKRVAVFASVATLAGGAVAGCGSDAATTNGTTAQQQSGQPPQGGRGMDFTALAKELGVSTTKLQAAMQKNRPQPAQQGQTGGAPTDMAANLAKELGLSESKVAAALKKLMPQGGPPAGANGQAPPNGQAAPSVTPSATTTS